MATTDSIWHQHDSDPARFIMPLPNGLDIRIVASPRGLSLNLLRGEEVIDATAIFPADLYREHFAVCEDCGYEYEDAEEGCDTCAKDPRKAKDTMPISGDRVEELIHRYSEEFLLGYSEARGEMGMTYDDDPWSDRSMAYDLGRTLGRGLLQLD